MIRFLFAGHFQTKTLFGGFGVLNKVLSSRVFGLILMLLLTVLTNPARAETRQNPKIVKITKASQLFEELESISNEVSPDRKARLCKTFIDECSETTKIFDMYSMGAVFLIVQFDKNRVSDLVYVTPYLRMTSVSGWESNMIIERWFPDEFTLRVDPVEDDFDPDYFDAKVTRRITFTIPHPSSPKSGTDKNVILEIRDVFPAADSGQMFDEITGGLVGWKKVAQYRNIDVIVHFTHDK